MASGFATVEKVEGKSTLTRCFSKYPLKLISPKKVGASSTTDAVWIYALSYGGGIVSGDCISVQLLIGDGCTAAVTTQASTKVYKSVDSKCSEQFLEAGIGRNALLALIPDPVTCFSTARYSQKQVFRVSAESNLVVVDWITSGRHESGEKWDFELYKSINHIYLEGDEPLFLDSGSHFIFRDMAPIIDELGMRLNTPALLIASSFFRRGKGSKPVITLLDQCAKLLVLLDHTSSASIRDRMQDYQAIAMVIILGPKLKHIQEQVQSEVKQMMAGKFHASTVAKRYQMRSESETDPAKPPLLASCSSFGPKGIGVVVRLAAMETESVYMFLRHNLASLEPFLGAQPYW